MRRFFQHGFRGAVARWWGASIFTLTGLGLGLVVPAALQRTAPETHPRVEAVVVEMRDVDEGMQRSVFEYAAPDGGRARYESPTASTHPAYLVGDRSTLVLDPESGRALHIEGDADLAFVIWAVRALGLVFFLIGAGMLARAVSQV